MLQSVTDAGTAATQRRSLKVFDESRDPLVRQHARNDRKSVFLDLSSGCCHVLSI
jgi:hypothetical protein